MSKVVSIFGRSVKKSASPPTPSKSSKGHPLLDAFFGKKSPPKQAQARLRLNPLDE